MLYVSAAPPFQILPDHGHHVPLHWSVIAIGDSYSVVSHPILSHSPLTVNNFVTKVIIVCICFNFKSLPCFGTYLQDVRTTGNKEGPKVHMCLYTGLYT